jgi:hypothetical protein
MEITHRDLVWLTAFATAYAKLDIECPPAARNAAVAIRRNEAKRIADAAADALSAVKENQ